eukprot:3419354-Alexandrium_andersonii.AAC.1
MSKRELPDPSIPACPAVAPWLACHRGVLPLGAAQNRGGGRPRHASARSAVRGGDRTPDT